MTGAAQSIILCEGVYDRAFWKGWLTRLGCTKQQRDPFGNEVKGHFGFDTPTGRFVRVVPCFGKNKLLPLIELELKGRTTKPIEWFIANLDSDAAHDDDGTARRGRVQSVLERFHRQGAVREVGSHQYALEDGTKLGIALWEAQDRAHPELPAKQTLERLVCAAMRSAFPARATAVESWLAQRPEPEASGCSPRHEKAFAWSYMAGWYAERGCDEFYQAVWADDAVVHALEPRLRHAGVWQLVEALVASDGGPPAPTRASPPAS